MDEILGAVLRALAFGTPLLLASLGAIINERAGVVNLGVEGMMILGALTGFAVAYGDGTGNGNLFLAVLAAMSIGALASMVHAFVTITLRANQFVSGLALTMLGLGISGLLGKRFEGMPLFNQAPEWIFTLAAVVLALLLAFMLYATHIGLMLRSIGENPASADVLGMNVTLVRYLAVAFGGAMAGAAGAFLSIASRPSGSFFFGLLYYLQFALQGKVPIPSEVFAAMPYLLVVVVLALAGSRGQQGAVPESLGRPYLRGER
jgi:general nucleoside transport system permease protein